jgi:hypothetical protein
VEKHRRFSPSRNRTAGIIVLGGCRVRWAKISVMRLPKHREEGIRFDSSSVMEDNSGVLTLGSIFLNGRLQETTSTLLKVLRGERKLVGQKTKYDIEGITAVDPSVT